MKFLKRIQYNAPIVLTFSILSLVVLLVGFITGGSSTTLLFSVYRAPLNQVLTWIRFFTHCLGHANYEHFIANILLILVVGPPIEERYGSKTLLLIMLITAFITGWAAWLVFPHSMVLGASGLVYMLIILSSFGGQSKGRIPLTLILVAILYLGGEIISGIVQDDNISQLTHVIGGICGGFLGFVLRGGGKEKSPSIEDISAKEIHERAVGELNSEFVPVRPAVTAPDTADGSKELPPNE